MGIGPVTAIKALLASTGLKLADIDRIEINEAFGCQVLACARELDIDRVEAQRERRGHRHRASAGRVGVRLTLTLARELQRSGGRYGIASACIGGGQGIAMLHRTNGLSHAGRTAQRAHRVGGLRPRRHRLLPALLRVLRHQHGRALRGARLSQAGSCSRPSTSPASRWWTCVRASASRRSSATTW